MILWNYCKRRPFIWHTNNGQYWAIITGATDGIGYEFARQLALKGYNIVMISRNLKKLTIKRQMILDELSNKNINIKIETIGVDFQRLDIYDQIKSIIEDKDVYILVNNVGIVNIHESDYFHLESSDYHHNMINVNIISVVKMTEMLLPKMIKQKRGLILNMSSNVAERHSGFYASYSSTKAFILNLSKTLHHECLSRNVLIFALMPLFIQSKMIAIPPSISIPTSECYVQNALKSINWNQSYGCGYFWHRLLSTGVKIISIIFGERIEAIFSRNVILYIQRMHHDRTLAESSNFFRIIFHSLWKTLFVTNEI